MSLKAFHIAFITVSTLLCGVFALWCFREIARGPDAFSIVGGVTGVLAVAGLIVYGVQFLRRARGVGYL